MRIPYGIRKRHIAWRYFRANLYSRVISSGLRRAKEMLKRDGWKEVSEGYSFL